MGGLYSVNLRLKTSISKITIFTVKAPERLSTTHLTSNGDKQSSLHRPKYLSGSETPGTAMESISSNGLGRKDEWDRPTPLRDSESDTVSSEYHTGTASFTPSYTPKTVLSSRILKQMGLVPIDDGAIEESSVVKGSEVFNRFLKKPNFISSLSLMNHIYITLVVRKMKSLIETFIFLKKEPFGTHQKPSMFS